MKLGAAPTFCVDDGPEPDEKIPHVWPHRLHDLHVVFEGRHQLQHLTAHGTILVLKFTVCIQSGRQVSAQQSVHVVRTGESDLMGRDGNDLMGRDGSDLMGRDGSDLMGRDGSDAQRSS